MKKIFLLLFLSLISAFAYTQWIWQNPLPTGNVLLSVYFTDANTGLAVGGYGTIVKTADGGTTWTTLACGTTSSLGSVYFTNATTGFAAGTTGTILKTTDGGANWIALTSGINSNINSVYFTDANTGYLVTSSHGYSLELIFKTNNAGNKVCNGIYFVRIISDKSILTNKFVKID